MNLAENIKKALGVDTTPSVPQGIKVGNFTLTPNAAEKLGFVEAEKKQSQQQMSHTQSSSQGGLPEDYVDPFSDKGGAVGSVNSLGDIHPMFDFIDPQSLAKHIGVAALVKGQKIYRGTDNPSLGKTSRRIFNPGKELGEHVSIDSSTARLFSEQRHGTDKVLESYSNVNKPLVVSDGKWTADAFIPRVLLEHPDLDKKLKDSLLKEYMAYETTKLTYSLDDLEKGVLDDKFSFRIQNLLKKYGYDHISYINMREGDPVESAILFDKDSHSLARVVTGKEPKTIHIKGLEDMEDY